MHVVEFGYHVEESNKEAETDYRITDQMEEHSGFVIDWWQQSSGSLSCYWSCRRIGFGFPEGARHFVNFLWQLTREGVELLYVKYINEFGAE